MMRRCAASLAAVPLVAFCLIASGCAALPVAPEAEQVETWDGPDTLFVGSVHTLDVKKPLAEAVLVRGPRIACVGTLGECNPLAKPDAVRVSAGAGSILPGIVDSHVNVLPLGRALRIVRCDDAPTEDECVRRVAERAKDTPAGDWIHGYGWDERNWPGREIPRERSLSLAVPDHPVLLERVDRSAVWVNERALALAGVHEYTPDPLGGRIARYGDGRPSGVLFYDAQELVRRAVNPPSVGENEAALLEAIREFARVGVTAIHEIDVTPETLDAYAKLAREGRLPLRVYAILDGRLPRADLEHIVAPWRAEPTLGNLTVRGVALHVDGKLEDRKAALLEPYADAPETSGTLLVDRAEIEQRIEEIVGWGMQPVFHASGDRAVAEVIAALDAMNERLKSREDEAAAAARKERERKDEARRRGGAVVQKEDEPVAKWHVRLEDVEVIAPEAGAKMRDLGVVVSMQPLEALAATRDVADRLGAARLDRAYPWREMTRWPIPMAFGSGFPDFRHDPRRGIVAAEERKPVAGEAFTPQQRVTRLQALRAYAIGGAAASMDERRRGVIRWGADADLTILAGDLMAVPPHALVDMRTLATVVGGTIVWESERLLRNDRKPGAATPRTK